MTKNHILIKSIALGVFFMLSVQTYAAGVDRALVIYFNKMYEGQSPKCTIDEAVKTSILAELEPKCLIRTTIEGQPFISGVTSACSNESVKTAVNTKVNALCANSAYEAEKAMLLRKQQEAVATQQAAANKGSGGGSGAAKGPSVSDMAKMARDTYKDLNVKGKKAEEAYEKRGEIKDKISKGVDKAKDAPASTKPADTAKVEPKPVVTPTATQNIDPLADDKRALEIMRNNHDIVCGNPNYDQSPCAGYKRGIANKENEIATKSDELASKAIAEQQAAADKAKKESEEALKKAPASMQKDAKENITGPAAQAAASTTDAAKAAADKAADARGKAAETKAGTVAADSKTTAATAPINCQAELQAVEAANKSYDLKKTICVKAANTADNFCDKLRSPGLKQVQQYMTLGTAILSKVTAASEACGTTSTLSKVAQGGVLAAQLTCTTVKFTCDKGCTAAKTALQTFKEANTALKTCASKVQASAQAKQTTGTAEVEAVVTAEHGALLLKEATAENQHAVSVQKSTGTYDTLIADEEKPATLTDKMDEEGKPGGKEVVGGSEREHATLLCSQKAAADMMMMGTAALGLLSAFDDAENCKKQLASGDSGGAGKSTSALAGPTLTTAEYCGIPVNATSITCKCTANPNADGCMGSIAKSGIALGKVGSGSGASAFASAGSHGLGSLDPLKKSAGESAEPEPGAGLSAAAREALGIGASAGGELAAAGGAGAASNPENAAKIKEEKEKAKFGFFSSLGNMFSGGRKPDQAANATIRKFEQDQAIKRKLASDQVRAEISTASGKSNFDKIRTRYQQNAASFEQ